MRAADRASVRDMEDGDDAVTREQTTQGDGTLAERPGAMKQGTGPGLANERYRIEKRLAKGGMGEVMIAYDEQIGRTVAIKRMRTASPSERQIERFLREARIQGRLAHPAICKVHEIGLDEAGAPFFAMERLEGVTLAQMFEQGAEGDKFRVLRAFVDVCLAIELAHTRGVVHRDLKPDNIMLGSFGEVFVIDWGVAKVIGEPDGDFADIGSAEQQGNQTAAGTVLGTPGYMAPEQVRGETDIDGRTDVYALGCVLFEILAGQPVHPPGRAGLESALIGGMLRPSVRAPGREVPPELDDLCVQALEADRDLRLRTARELGDRVQRYLDGDRDLAQRKDLALIHLDRARGAYAREQQLEIGAPDRAGRERKLEIGADLEQAGAGREPQLGADPADGRERQLGTGATDRASYAELGVGIRESGAHARRDSGTPRADDDRAMAMREAGRALALDPTLTEAAELVTRLMLEPPKVVPPEVEQAIELENRVSARANARIGMFAYLAFLGFSPLLWLIAPDAVGFTLAVSVLILANAGLLFIQSRAANPRPFLIAVLNAAMIAVVARMFTPFFIAPAIAALIAMGIVIAQKMTRLAANIVVGGLLSAAVLVPWLLELADVLSTTTTITANGLVLDGIGIGRTSNATLIVAALYVVLLIGVACTFGDAMRNRERAAKRHILLQTWQLRQLVAR